jgi:UDP:flavonoid glycosyltransferase YjiC (YdhE family)
MWGSAYTPLIENSRWFDLIIEPGEIAAERDYGVTARRRPESTLVNPIRLLDDDELLTKSQARSALGLDQTRPAVLLQLGAGANRDIVKIIDAVIRAIQAFPDVQIALAEWATAESHALWPRVKTIRGFPLSQYFNAFDFSVAAAGYNTFHEAISFALPTVFIPNASPGQDDQVARAQFAQDHGAAFELPEDRLFELPAICEALLSTKARNVLKENCRRIGRGNGAQEAASALTELIAVA